MLIVNNWFWKVYKNQNDANHWKNNNNLKLVSELHFLQLLVDLAIKFNFFL